jgi:ABC-type dipeptide/oligopeptide/nickel transport system permease component
MLRYLVRRIGFSVLVLYGIITLVFFVARLSPQDPVLAILRLNATSHGQVDPVEYARVRHQLGLDEPLLVQYLRYLTNLAHGNLGDSIMQHRSVMDILVKGVPVSLQLSLAGLVLQVVIGTVIGVWAAAHQNRRFDRLAMGLAIWFGAIPQLVVGVVLMVVFGVKLRWLMPLITLTVTGVASYARFSRAATLEQINQDFARTARAKGLTQRRVLFGHVLRNAMIPILTFVGPSLAFIITGNFIIETMFGIPGVAYYAITSLINNDYPVMQATVILWGVAIMVINLATDLAYGAIDPRVRLA